MVCNQPVAVFQPEARYGFFCFDAVSRAVPKF